MKINKKITASFSKKEIEEIRCFREFLESFSEEDWNDLETILYEEEDLDISVLFDWIDNLLCYAENHKEED